MNDPKREVPAFLAPKEKAIRFRNKRADELNEVSTLSLTDASRIANITALQNFIEACDKAIQEDAGE
jgi:hypothetical protein